MSAQSLVSVQITWETNGAITARAPSLDALQTHLRQLGGNTAAPATAPAPHKRRPMSAATKAKLAEIARKRAQKTQQQPAAAEEPAKRKSHRKQAPKIMTAGASQ